jgi:hypothetical protein
MQLRNCLAGYLFLIESERWRIFQQNLMDLQSLYFSNKTFIYPGLYVVNICLLIQEIHRV